MRLSEIFKGITRVAVSPADNVEIAGIACNSKAVYKDYLFVAIRGSQFDGHNFIDEAIRRGAIAVVVQEGSRVKGQGLRSNLTPYPLSLTPVFIEVPDTTIALAQVSDNFYNHPSQKLNVIGITGTNGKTTTSYLVESILQAAGFPCGMIGTINYKIGKRTIPATNTTPNALDIQCYLSTMADMGIKFCVMEASSHSLSQRRVDSVDFSSAVFTNLGSDHLDYHKTKEEYFLAKLKLFTGLRSEGWAVINIDDLCGRKILKLLKTDYRANILTYGCSKEADIYADSIVCSSDGLRFTIRTPKGNSVIASKLFGRHNLYNILASTAATLYFGVNIEDARLGIERLEGVRGRLEVVENPYRFKLIIDYAHTDEALVAVLSAMKELGKDIILVFGCGGDRDRTKRRIMGKTAARYARYIYITTDNPRSEGPMQIASEIEDGVKEENFTDYEIITDRELAIKEALRRAIIEDDEKLCVLIAGKGHETYQVMKDSIVPFDDREVARGFLKEIYGAAVRSEAEGVATVGG